MGRPKASPRNLTIATAFADAVTVSVVESTSQIDYSGPWSVFALLKACLAELSLLGTAGERLAEHLRQFMASYDMETIQKDYIKNKDSVVDLLVRNVLTVNIEIPKVVKGTFWA